MILLRSPSGVPRTIAAGADLLRSLFAGLFSKRGRLAVERKSALNPGKNGEKMTKKIKKRQKKEQKAEKSGKMTRFIV